MGYGAFCFARVCNLSVWCEENEPVKGMIDVVTRLEKRSYGRKLLSLQRSPENFTDTKRTCGIKPYKSTTRIVLEVR